MLRYFTIAILFLFHLDINGQDLEMRKIEGGVYIPLYGSQEEVQVEIAPFYMDAKPVTHQEFAEFIKQYPQWSKDNVKALFADASYLTK